MKIQKPIPDFLQIWPDPMIVRPINGHERNIPSNKTILAEEIAAANDKRNVGWAPFPGGQVQYLSCPVREVFLEGNRGGGKTELLLVRYLSEVGKHGDAWRGVIFRREYKHLEDLIAKSKRLFRKLNVKARWLSSKGDYKWVFDSGEELHFRAMKFADDYWNYHGHEYPFIAWEELTNYPDDQCYEKMKSCNRCSVPGVPRWYHSTGNPFGAGHGWVKQRFIDLGPSGTIYKSPDGMMRVRIHVDLDDNKALLAADPEYVAQLEAIENPALRAAWRRGDWDITVGGFLQGVWDHTIHVVDDFEIPRDWKHWRALDMGFAAPYSVGWYAKDPVTNNVYRYRELYGWGGKPNVGTRQSPEEIAEMIVEMEAKERARGVEFNKNPADTSLWGATSIKVASREITQAELMRTVTDAYGKGVGWIPAKKGPGSRINGAQVVIHALQRAVKGQQGGFYVTRSCKHFIRTVPILMPDPDNWEDVDTDMEDHCFSYGTEIRTRRGIERIGDLVGTEGEIWSVDGWQKYENCRLTRKTTETVALRFEDGHTVRCTPDHRFIAEDGTWIEAKNLAGRKALVSYLRRSTSKNIYEKSTQISASQNFAATVGLATRPQSQPRPVPSFAQGDVKPLRCVSVEPGRVEDVYCLTVPATGVFSLANGLLVSNCWDEFRYSIVSHQKIFSHSAASDGEPKPGTFDWLMKYSNGDEKPRSVYRRSH